VRDGRAIDAGLVVIDSGPAFMDAGLKSNSEEDIRRMLRPLQTLAERCELPVIVIAHLNKGQGSGGNRIMGGKAWRNAPRVVLMVGTPDRLHPSETSQRILVGEKSNLGRVPVALGFSLVEFHHHPDLADVAWGDLDESVRAADVLAAPDSPDERGA
jgi:hypothetical protein